MLIIEGADLVGKTTLQKECVRLLNLRGLPHMPMHLTRPPANFDYYRGYLQLISRDTVWDRFHLSSLAYRQCDDHECSMTPLKYSLVDAKIRQMPGFIVLIVGEEKTIRQRFQSRGDTMYSVEHIVSVNRAFERMIVTRDVSVRGRDYRFDVDYIMQHQKHPIKEAERIVEEYIGRRKQHDLL